MTQRVCAASAAAGNAAAQWQQTTATGASIPKLRERLPTRRAHWTSVITVLSVMSHMYCCAKWCSTSGKSGEHLFRFPSDHRFSIWLKYANRLELLETPREKVYKTYRLCSKHFTRDCFTSDACTRLTHEAVPSVKVHEPRLRALVHPDFYEEGAAQGEGTIFRKTHPVNVRPKGTIAFIEANCKHHFPGTKLSCFNVMWPLFQLHQTAVVYHVVA
ncbi:hypothetical protein V5799_016489 [Amblyomma americanum]|uniref:THAP-type domain-containing protein n=1 Tax=Amblyomma americanum TaxID=6943 RepID=A0AAQ4F4Z3_AMBAM